MTSQTAALAFRMARGADDLPHIVTLARAAHADSRYGYIPFSEEKVRARAGEALAEDAPKVILLAFRGEEPVGMLGLTIGEYMIGTDVKLASIHNFTVLRHVRAALSGGKVAIGLMRGAQRWAEAQGAKELSLHVSSGVDLQRTHKLAQRMGFEFVGGNYAKPL